jgi:hypothetical protein
MEEFKQNAHLFLGLTRKEFERRLQQGLIDCELLKSQIEQNAHELELETTCEKYLSKNAVDQIDIFEAASDDISL